MCIKKIMDLKRSKHRERVAQVLATEADKNGLTRSHTMHSETNQVTQKLRSLNRLISIDKENREAWFEAGITMEQLSLVLAQHGWMPLVVPEFKGITLSGAISGAAGESSSFRYGLVSDTATAYLWVSPDLQLIEVSPEKESDLFYGLAGSYGALGAISAVKLRIAPLRPFVRLTYSFEEELEGEADFIDACQLTPEKGLVMRGHLLDRVPAESRVTRYNRARDPWFIQRLRLLREAHEEIIPLHDYFFRWDRGAFWMGGFVTRLPDLWEMLRHRLPSDLHLNLDLSRLFRLGTSRLYSSNALYVRLHELPKELFAKAFVIQDFMIPKEREKEFRKRVQERCPIYPLWRCPVKGTTTPQFLSPHYGEGLFINVGVYGHVPGESAIAITRDLECLCKEFGGRKTLYAHNHYSSEKLWEIYDQERLETLRNRYGLNDSPNFSSILYRP